MRLSVKASLALVPDPGFHAVLEAAGRLRECDRAATCIKLDRSLLAEIDSDPARRAFVTAIAGLSNPEGGAGVTYRGATS